MGVSIRRVLLKNRYGLHARPINKFVICANRFESAILVTKDAQEVDGKSVMGMMLLAADKGDELTIRAEGRDSEEAVEALSELVDSGFGEE